MKINGGAGIRLNRIPPLMPTGNYKTFALRQPLATHFRKATCQEIECEAYMNGWNFRREGMDPRLYYVATHSHRSWREVVLAPGESYLVFEPGQPCFDADNHRIAIDRPAFFFAGRGDFRSFTTRQARQHANADDWVDEFATQLDQINTQIERG